MFKETQKKGARKRRKKIRLIKFLIKWFIFLLILAFLGTFLIKQVNRFRSGSMFRGIDVVEDIFYSGEYEEELKAAVNKNPELKDFVKNYDKYKDKEFKIDLSKEAGSGEVPLLMQWDKRWGYDIYAGEPFALSGCGPTCLSMVCLKVLEDEKYTPSYIAEFAENNGYSLNESGSYWTLVSEGGVKLGLDVVEIPNVEQRIIDNLNVGNPIICIMGPGDFTENGHFVVMTEYVDGKIKINDPYRKSNSEKLWDFEEIIGQIQNLWVCRQK